MLVWQAQMLPGRLHCLLAPDPRPPVYYC